MNGIHHTGRKHAKLSASGSDRWLNCPGSVKLEQFAPKQPYSSYASEGTLAHELADLNLARFLGDYTGTKQKKEMGAKILRRIESNKLYKTEMIDFVGIYTDFVLDELKRAQNDFEDAFLTVEERLDFSDWVPEGFGTGDATIISDKTIHVIDLKYGAGIPVSAEDNSQLKLYGLGAYAKYFLMYDFDEVILSIVQPRLQSISTFKISVKDLLFWADNVVAPTAKKAIAGKGEVKSGSWCRWCKVKHNCKVLANKNIEAAILDFAEDPIENSSPDLYSDNELVIFYRQIPQIKKWITSVESHLLARALEGDKIEGLKIVEGKGRRYFTDPEKVEDLCLDSGLEPENFMNTKLKGITIIENLFSVDKFNKLFGALVDKKGGPLKLVDSRDKRPEFGLSNAQDDFE
tara:strand:+ start:31337 stop:32548 length:1212 start_codon:yes stop_codon:yes gene_type:complete